ncbi:peptide-methionine (S)-S-oxide reductase MsrA [Marinospirillum perlucidum]|uniref:peptide-methionine (S)-S-oxide reductase MsrA n=1 Tax=Marinospirillum perlucidum TaxID=1982602 RepID=UPI000DF234B4|nr:peptide-methionine (S)-S-oxide reductase MsrA [Marinospirillum perlucidum]
MSVTAFSAEGERRLAPTSFPLPDVSEPEGESQQQGWKRLVLGGGCFWCVEAVFQLLPGVQQVVSGYAGGEASTANYEAVCSGQTGHAEVVAIDYDPVEISRGRLLQVFFSVAHNPTQLDRQGADRGPQYRSVIFYQTEQEKHQAQAYIQQLEAAGAWSQPLVTRLEALEAFYPAEDYHQDFVRQHPGQPYVEAVARPKLEQALANFSCPLPPS